MKVFFTRKIAPLGIQMIQDAGHQVFFWEKTALPTFEELIAICQKMDALVVADANRIKAPIIEACPHLKVIALHSVGYANVDLTTARRLGIPVGYTPDSGTEEVAELALLLLLAVSKKAFYAHKWIKTGEWQFFDPTAHIGQDIKGKTLGIFGLGDIGSAMARLCQAVFKMKIIYHNRHPKPEIEKELGAIFVSFDELLTQSDVLSIHSPLTKETRGKFDQAAFEKMKHTAILINTARGNILDEEALTEALISGRLWGAGLDVTRPEPMAPNNPLLELPTVAITPHIGNAIDTARNRMARMIAENIIAAGKQEPIPYPVPPASF